MKELKRWLLKDGKEFIGFDILKNGVVYCKYKEVGSSTIINATIDDNVIFNVRCNRLMYELVDKILQNYFRVLSL